MERNKQAAIDACEHAYSLGRLTGETIIPVTPLVNFIYLDENEPEERKQALKLGLGLLSKCDELWVAGDRISEGMRGEIRAAVRMNIPVMSMGLEQETIQNVISDLPPLLTEKNCFKNSANRNYAGELLVLKSSALAPWAKEPENQLWIAKHGFGVNPNLSGRAVYAKCLYDGEDARWNRNDFHGVANPEKLPDWAKEKLMLYENESEELEQ
ncbi:MAG: hypothetical protein LBN43_08215 [Oscillospiraceae bacterium]|jgi:hypothetical protein|nr:hypothetical protein [Oscillospiraceae bacterium]